MMIKSPKIKHWMWVDLALILYDFLMTYASYMLALLVRYDFLYSNIDPKYINIASNTLVFVGLFTIGSAYLLRLYNFIWRFASVSEILRCLTCSIFNTIFNFLLTIIFYEKMPISYYLIGFVFQFFFISGIRFSYRVLLSLRSWAKNKVGKNNIMVIGAGEAGSMIIKDINKTEDGEKVVCVIDDNPNKWNRYVDSVPVVGNRDTIHENIHKYNISKIVVAIPSTNKNNLKNILDICHDEKVDVKIIPSIARFAKEDLSISSLRDVEISDLLGRDEIKTDLQEVFSFIENKTILVTGAGGSIGSELVRQIAANRPKKLILFDIYENSTYFLELYLKKKYPTLDLVTLIGSVRDQDKVLELFDEYKIDVVYHAAAHKHVPLMQDSPNEAIKNNTFGTFNVALAAIINNTKRFVLISTDKAVNPTNVMGASKRICEMIIQDFNKCIELKETSKIKKLVKDLYSLDVEIPDKIDTIFSAVRFGNVLGSNGSVIPIFKEQIAKGGPVTVTDPNINRYFMTIPEAVALVLQASVYAKGGEIFVLDMGEPVKIVDLAKQMIKLAGQENKVKIVFTGLRPGEKLYEERLMDEEGLKKTANDLISIAKPLNIDTTKFFRSLKTLYKKAKSNDKNIVAEVNKIAPINGGGRKNIILNNK